METLNTPKKPRLLFFRPGRNWTASLPQYILSHLRQQEKCLSLFFDVRTINGNCDYGRICDLYEPDLCLFESGVYGSPQDVRNTSAFPEIPKLGFLHADAYCLTRSVFLSNMERWGIDTYFTLSIAMAEYVPEIADQLFVWPNFVDPAICYDYKEPKKIPVLIIGSRAPHYPW